MDAKDEARLLSIFEEQEREYFLREQQCQPVENLEDEENNK